MRHEEHDVIHKPDTPQFVMYTDKQRGSYAVIGRLYRLTLSGLGYDLTEVQTPESESDHKYLAENLGRTIVLHNTLGFLMQPVPNAYNIALPHHEWTAYPPQWVAKINAFQEVWTTSLYVKQILQRSGVAIPVRFMPPALDLEPFEVKQDWKAHSPFRFFSCGEAHFRKGFHLLFQGFMESFRTPGEAVLTIKTSPSCDWNSPRKDIVLIKERLAREDLLALYRHQDCYISASMGEGLGLPLAEAIMSLVPVAANNFGGHKSIVCAKGYFRIGHTEVDQVFCSRPSYYTKGQKCGLSAPEQIAARMQEVAGCSSTRREVMVRLARRNLLKRYGREVALKRIQSWIECHLSETSYDDKMLESITR